MSLELSSVVTARKKVHSDGYSYYQLQEKSFGGLIDPVLSLEHFAMSEDAFPSRPRAGFSAATYLFEDSPGGMLNRDSLGERSEIPPGGLHWTVTGCGMIHEEKPLASGLEVRGLQLQVNLSAAGKRREPQAFHVDAAHVPEWKPSAAVRGRVLAGRQGGVVSPVTLPESFTWVEIRLRGRGSYSPRVPVESGALIYLVSGKLRVSSGEKILVLESLQAIGMQTKDKHGEPMVEALEDSHFFFLSGRTLREAIVSHGNFVMNTQAEIAEKISAYQRGEMGRLE